MKKLFALVLFALSMVAHAQDGAIAPPGFHVSGSRLLDQHGVEKRIRGVNHAHWDQQGANTGIPLSGANTVRIVVDFTQTVAYNTAVVTPFINAGLTPIVGNWTGTCKDSPATLSTIVDAWVAQASTWAPMLNTIGLVNIANEWGPPNSAVWRDSYIDAITRMRRAGYTGTLVIDSGGCGQDPYDITVYGAAVEAADPLHNILFDVHVYGAFSFPATLSWQIDYTKAMAQLKATGLPIILGEFGPGRNIGPSPTLLPPERVITDAENNGWGWLAWAWDDNDLTGCKTDDGWFGMTTSCATYTGKPGDLTSFGKSVVSLLQVLNGIKPPQD